MADQNGVESLVVEDTRLDTPHPNIGLCRLFRMPHRTSNGTVSQVCRKFVASLSQVCRKLQIGQSRQVDHVVRLTRATNQLLVFQPRQVTLQGSPGHPGTEPLALLDIKAAGQQ